MNTPSTNLDKVLERVRKLVEKAEAPIAAGATPEERAATLREQATAREMADALMLRYAIDQASLRTGKAGETPQMSKPGKMRVDLCGVDSHLRDQLARLLWAVTEYTRCKALVYGLHARWNRNLAEAYRLGGHPVPRVYAEVYGFEHDLRYFELMFTVLSLHLANGIDPKPDFGLSLEENAYTLHSAGFNWLDIARHYGWPENGEPATMAGSRVKRAYHRYCRDHGIAPVSIPASGRVTFQRNFAEAYVSRIRQRLDEAAGKRQQGTELLLASAANAVREAYNEVAQKAKTHSPTQYGYNPEAYGRGVNHANTADLNGSRVGQTARKEVHK